MRHFVRLGIVLGMTAASCGSPDPSEFRGTWTRNPPYGLGLSYLSLDTSDGGLRLEVGTFAPNPRGPVSFHGHEVTAMAEGFRVGQSTALDPFEVEWASSDELDVLFAGTALIRSASWAEIGGAHTAYGESLHRQEGGDGKPELRLPPAFAVELGLGPDESLVLLDAVGLFTQWTPPVAAVGRWQSINWPATLVQQTDGGLVVTDWPATRLDLDTDGGFHFFSLAEGRVRSLQGTVGESPEGRWLFETDDAPPLLVLDDNTSIQPERYALAGRTQRALQVTVMDFTSPDGGVGVEESGLVITGLESPPLKPVTRP